MRKIVVCAVLALMLLITSAAMAAPAPILEGVEAADFFEPMYVWDLGDESTPLYVLFAGMIATGAGAIIVHKKRVRGR